MLSDKAPAGLSRMFQRLPSAPRCKMCLVPFSGVGGAALKLLGWRRFKLNPQICSMCIRFLEKHTGGAEVEISLLFVDVRGSTPLAEKITPSEFTGLLNRFFEATTSAVDAHDGVIDHLVGDGVMAMWIPAFARGHHAQNAIAAGIDLLDAMEEGGLADQLPVGGGVHTGIAYVGTVGSDRGSLDFTSLGDTPNTAARLGSAAGAGELLVSQAAALAAGISVEHAERRYLDLKGKSAPVEAWVVRSSKVPRA